MMRAAFVVFGIFACTSSFADPCKDDQLEGPAPGHDAMTLTKAKFADLPGWTADKLSEAVPSFLSSCAKLGELADGDPVGVDGHGGVAKQWRHACAEAAKLHPGDDAAARAFFETEFAPFVAAGKTGPNGKLTGFDVQEIHASRTRHGKFQIPVLGRPSDLVMMDLGTFVRDGHGRHLWGRLTKDGELEPFYTRSEIRKGALAAEHLELMYADDPVDVLFAQIEGSAKARLDDGSVAWLEFAGKNGRAYVGVGGALKRKGALAKPGSGTMQGIRKWFVDHPGRFDEIVDDDASYVFFKESKLPGAVGSQKVILTAQRSMAVDRAFIAMSTPVFVETRVPVVGKLGTTAPWQHLLIAQDTGAGIMGAVRGDIYWGDDRAAEELGGRMGGPGRYWVLLPKGVTK
ncbi:MAG: MltA domain-containing protein [Kofleriaceae bacterium]